MNYISLLLNGAWDMFYREEAYLDETVPTLTKLSHEPDCRVENAVPNYWEDMTEEFRAMPFFGKLKINPEYGVQSYPILGTAPDMALPNIVGNFFYKRTVLLEDTATDCVIRFEGVQNAVSVWINESFIGRHEGYSAPFEMKIPDGLLRAGENSIILSVSNHRLKGYGGRGVSGLTSRAANEYTGGITGDVELRFYKNPIRDLAVFCHKDLESIVVDVETVADVKLDWEITDEGRVVKSGSATGSFVCDAEGLQPWSPESPRLYTLTLKCGGYTTSRVFGVRRLRANGVRFRLNGLPYYLRGITEHCYFPETIHPAHDKEYYKSIIRKIKELGFNFIRFHTYIPEEEYMQAADELGVLLHVECPNYTSLQEWEEIVRFCRRHTSVVIYCCGNELYIDGPYMKYLNECADVVHGYTDGLFSPLSALPNVEYSFREKSEEVLDQPFEHNPKNVDRLGVFSDMYSSYAIGKLSYFSLDADPEAIDSWSDIYKRPRVSHEICIDGTFTDLSLKDRYKGTRVGKTEIFSSVEKHLEEKGLLKDAPLFFNNSSQWQRRIRKHCFESARLCDKLAGFDFLGPIDTHWHTFGYDVGMMNEFYELKPGETVENVLRYNSPTVVLTDLDKKYSFWAGEDITCGIYASHFGKRDLTNATLTVRLVCDGKVIYRNRVTVNAENGRVTRLCDLKCPLPEIDTPREMKLQVTLDGDEVYAENQWEIFVFPKTEANAEKVTVAEDVSLDELIAMLREGRTVVLLGKTPFVTMPTDFRIALAGRTAGNLATVIKDRPSVDGMPHHGFCSWQFCSMLSGGSAVCFDGDLPFDPDIQVVSTHKYAIRQSALFEFEAMKGKLLVCTFNFTSDDPAARWFKNHLITYAESDALAPRHRIDEAGLLSLANGRVKKAEANTNFAFNPNDKATNR